MTAPAIAATDLQVSYGRRVALSGVDLALESGERVALVGPNGAGKSTLLRALTGVLRPSAGEVRIQGRSVDLYERSALARHIAVVPQSAGLPFAMRVEEVVGLGRIPHEHPFRGPSDADRAAVDRAIARVGLGVFVGRDARELSLGERQLVLVATALAQEAPILLLDEPTVHLDLRHQVEVLGLLADLSRDGITILSVLHDLWLASRFFPRIVLLDGGRVVGDGPPAEVLAPHRVEEIYGVAPGFVPAFG